LLRIPRPFRSTSAPAGPGSGAFTLLELLIVIGIIAILAALAVPSLSSLGASQLKVAGRDLSNALSEARSLSISKRQLFAVGVATTDHAASGTEAFRTFAILAKDRVTGAWEITRRFDLPERVWFEPVAPMPDYVATATYAAGDSRVINSGFAITACQTVTADSGEDFAIMPFLPSGASRPAMANGDLIFHYLLVEALVNTPTSGAAPSLTYLSPDSSGLNTPANWVHVSLTSLTGRTEVYQP